ncbi:unnamed protein product [Moneuplotes crassus]|uniref:Seipin n=1 Tax=Euplotes crassus TaxID=5936 RepID=A0AAD2D1E1_EUPCR|nr:unnamed protein product [Moneuplotes crassus]
MAFSVLEPFFWAISQIFDINKRIIHYILWTMFPDQTEYMVGLIKQVSLTIFTFFFKSAILCTKIFLYTSVFSSLAGLSILVSFVTYSLFYHFYMPHEYQRQELVFLENQNSLLAELSLDCYSYEKGVPPPSDCLILQDQKYMAFLDMDIVETEDTEKIVSIYTSAKLTSVDNHTKTFNQRSNIRYKNSFVKYLHMAVFSIPQLVGFSDDDLQKVSVPLFDHVDNTVFNISDISITLKPQLLRFYSAEISITAQLGGMQYYMKKWFLSCLLIFVGSMASCMFIYCFVMIVTFWVIVRNKIRDHLDFNEPENSYIKLFILRSIF